MKQLSNLASFFNLVNFTVLLSLLSLSSCNSDSRRGLNPGDYPPDVELTDLNNELHKLSDYRGKVVLLNFWATWCTPCIDEIPALQSLYEELGKENFVVVSIGIDDEESAFREFKQRFSITFPILIDKSSSLKNKFKITGVPESFILDKQGKLAMLPDPSDNMPVVRIVGPREWASANAISRLRALIN